jgi:dTDP-4-dehydrorhamnose 3,5-epimerase
MLDARPLELAGLVELRPARQGDERGFFSEVWNRKAMAAAGLHADFVQDNHSLSETKGTLRGLHYQLPPAAQTKLIRVTRGAVFDVVVDIRRGSQTFGRWTGLVLSANLWNQLYIPPGFAHGFLTLEPQVEVQYKVTAPYRPDLERVIRFDDPAISVEWPVVEYPTLSARDRNAAPLDAAELPEDWQ